MKCCLGFYSVTLIFVTITAQNLGVVKITPSSPEFFVKERDSLTVECSVTTDKDGKLQWEKPYDHDVTNKKRTELKKDATKYFDTLTIDNIVQNHLGNYTCKYGSSSASFKLLFPKEDKVTANFTYGDKTATISCNIGGAAASKDVEKVVWLKNDTLVSELSDHKRFSQIAENNTLIITETTREDADLYFARFIFKDGTPAYDCAVPYRAAPLVLDFDKSKNLIEDDTMELQCKVKGYPHATVTWMKNNKPLNITENSRISQTTLNGYKNARLVIESIQFDDAGDYTCRAYSDYFNMSTSKTLVVRVKDKLAALWPFLGIVGEVIVLCTIIFIYEKRRNKQAENEANNTQDVDGSVTDKKEGLRHRNTQSNNPTA